MRQNNPTGPFASHADAQAGRVVWIWRGRPSDQPRAVDGRAIPDDELLRRHGCVKITTGREGTALAWAGFSANWSSLYCALEYVSITPGPWTLRFFIGGWFSETYEDLHEARARMGVVLAKSDVFLQPRAYIRNVEAELRNMPVMLAEAWENRAASPDLAVDVAHDPHSGRFQVGRIGTRSLIARYYGLSPVSYPCQAAHSYHYAVSRAYERVLHSRQPHYDHVLAPFRAPDGSLHWFGYQRVVLPAIFPDGSAGVSVLSNDAPADIRLI